MCLSESRITNDGLCVTEIEIDSISVHGKYSVIDSHIRFRFLKNTTTTNNNNNLTLCKTPYHNVVISMLYLDITCSLKCTKQLYQKSKVSRIKRKGKHKVKIQLMQLLIHRANIIIWPGCSKLSLSYLR